MTTAARGPAVHDGEAPATRSVLRAVAVPTEHGGWGLSGEPVLLGLLVAPSVAGVMVGVATVLAFVVRTPLKVVLVDRHRHRHRDRTRVARRVVAVEGAVLVAVVAAATVLAGPRIWWPLAVAAPLVVLELWFDMRSRGRRLVPELAGAVGVSAAAAVIVLAGDGSAAVALGVWLVLAARSISSIPHVRARIARLHHRSAARSTLVLADGVAALAALAAVALDRGFLVGAAAVLVLVVVQWATDGREMPVTVVGIGQTIGGLLVVVATAIGAALA
ncbi:MAG: YwiC-like family protein [Acidimicrobiales bacterium]|nr:YwiC-like family protein [Acidimicrobiales bacterium]